MKNKFLTTKYIKLGAISFLSFAIFLTTFYVLNGKFNLFGLAGGANGVLSLPESTTVLIGDQFEVPVMVSSPDNTLSGVDILINFDQSKLQLIDVAVKPENSTLQNFLPILQGVALQNQFDKNTVINEANSSGNIKFGAFSYDARFIGNLGPTNPIAVLKFQANNSGTSNLRIGFAQGATNDSNLIDGRGNDTLGRVQDMVVNVNLLASPIPSVEPVPSPSPVELPTPSLTPTLFPSPDPSPEQSPLSSPLESPIASPEQSPIQSPVVSPIESPLQSPVQSPISTPRARRGDANGDGAVNALDFTIVVENYDREGVNIPGDVNNDTLVNALDFGVVVENYDR